MTDQHLRKGWTTGACAAAAAKAAFMALHGGGFPDPVGIVLPRGVTPSFSLARAELGQHQAVAGIIKDAGDDPDITHGALVLATVTSAPAGSGIHFRAGEGVGTITLPGLPLPPGEPAINPGPRAHITANLTAAAAQLGVAADAVVTIAIPGGEALAARTLNPRLGIVGGLSILGTTGVVLPYSCSAKLVELTTGALDLHPKSSRGDGTLSAETPLPLADYQVVVGRGPFDAQAEQDLLRRHATQVVVTKASGGTATHGKIVAARTLGLPVLMMGRQMWRRRWPGSGRDWRGKGRATSLGRGAFIQWGQMRLDSGGFLAGDHGLALAAVGLGLLGLHL